jgi:uncharacterized protein (TIGR02246 family)
VDQARGKPTNRSFDMQKTIVTFLMWTALAEAASHPAPATTPEPDASIVNAAATYLRAVLAGDATAVAALYREDAIEMPPCRPALRGRSAIEQYYRELFRSPVKITAFTFTHHEAHRFGDVGYTIGTYQQTLSGTPAGSIDDTGKYMVILKRSDRIWKAAYVMYNSDRPRDVPCAPAAVMLTPGSTLALLARWSAQIALTWLVYIGSAALLLALIAWVALLARAMRRRINMARRTNLRSEA